MSALKINVYRKINITWSGGNMDSENAIPSRNIYPD